MNSKNEPRRRRPRRRARLGLRARLSAAFVFVVLIPVLVGCAAVAILVPDVLRSQMGDRLRADRTDVVDVLAARCAQATLGARSLGLWLATVDPQTAVTTTLAETRADFAAVVNGSGAVVAVAGQPPSGNLSALDACGTGSGAATAIAARADLAVSGHPQWSYAVVGWRITPGTAAEIAARLPQRAAVTLAVGTQLVSTTLPRPVAMAELTGGPAGRDVFEVGSRIVAASAPSAGQPYRVLVSEPAPSLDQLFWVFAVVIVVTVIGAIAIGRLLARLISHPVAELSEAAGRVAGGDLDVTIEVRSRDEVGRLAAAFNHMTAELRTYIGELERSHRELRENLERLGSALAHTHNLPGILAVILDTAMASVRAGGGLIALIDSDGVLRVKTVRGVAGIAPEDALPVGAGIVGSVVADGEAVRGLVGEGPGLRPVAGEPRARAVLAVPLRPSGRLAGVLAVYDRQTDDETSVSAAAFSATDERSLIAFAGQASVAVENVLLHQEAQRLSLTDPLTGLWNYRYLIMTLGHEIERATRFRRPLTVLMLDLDRFKQINDRYGHQVGDGVLIELARRMRSAVREVDTVARYGGEEFVVILPETDAAGGARTAERLRHAIRTTPFHVEGLDLAVTASIGVAVFPQHGVAASPLLRAADEALYDAKESGRDTWRLARATDDDGPPASPSAAAASPAPEPSEPATAGSASVGPSSAGFSAAPSPVVPSALPSPAAPGPPPSPPTPRVVIVPELDESPSSKGSDS